MIVMLKAIMILGFIIIKTLGGMLLDGIKIPSRIIHHEDLAED